MAQCLQCSQKHAAGSRPAHFLHSKRSKITDLNQKNVLNNALKCVVGLLFLPVFINFTAVIVFCFLSHTHSGRQEGKRAGFGSIAAFKFVVAKKYCFATTYLQPNINICNNNFCSSPLKLCLHKKQVNYATFDDF